MRGDARSAEQRVQGGTQFDARRRATPARVGPKHGSRQGGVHPSTPTRSSNWGNTRDASKYSSAIARAVREWRS